MMLPKIFCSQKPPTTKMPNILPSQEHIFIITRLLGVNISHLAPPETLLHLSLATQHLSLVSTAYGKNYP